MENTGQKQRDAFASVFFSVNECCDAIEVLKEVNDLHTGLIMGRSGSGPLPVKRENVHVLVGMVRDSFCTRLAVLFDRRRDVHSLKKYFSAKEIETLEKHPVTALCIAARNNNICHMGKEYTKWPDVEAILSSELPDLLERIKVGLMMAR